MSSYDEKSSNEIEREVENSRDQVRRTLAELSERMSPGQLVDQAMDYMKTSNGTELAQNLGRQVRDNPLPLLLVGAGIGWLMLGGQPAVQRRLGHDDRRRWHPDDERLGAPLAAYGTGVPHRPTGTSSGVDSMPRPGSQYATSGSQGHSPSITERASSAAHSVGQTGGAALHAVSDAGSNAASAVSRAGNSAASAISGAASSVSNEVASTYGRASDAAASAYDRASEAATAGYQGAMHRAQQTGHAISGTASHLAHEAAHLSEQARIASERAAHYAQERFGRVIEDQPLVLGGIGLAIGALLGAALPRTRMENRLVGETADQFKDAVVDTAYQQYEHAAEVATDTYRNVVESVQESGVTDKVVGAVSQAADKIRETAHSATEQAHQAIDATADKAKQKAGSAGRSEGGTGSSTSAAGSGTTGSTGSSPSSTGSTASAGVTSPGSARTGTSVLDDASRDRER
ncbi:MAG TPA: DUF3618 domain-containing protein [Geminicoccus sp.]|uniref:DUF3618 domain-containing protein n=1 Tax=Geminicoccus sp. TaxID=2024832 RepID=UPI002BDEBCF1|nr:DUF3618 domain-containing protein [Geminicoccus sp.]HWL66911.1 DUF3618 domain-containing protein [Geminicoccus sp.]